MTYTATQSIFINANRTAVWQAITDPALISKWMLGTVVTTDWRPGSPVTYEGIMGGEEYRNSGEILEIVAEKLLKMTYRNPKGKGIPANDTIITYILDEERDGVHLKVTQENFTVLAARDHAEGSWKWILGMLKLVVSR